MTWLKSQTASLLTLLIMTAAGAPASLADPIRDEQWHLGFLNMDAAHAVTRGDGVIVAVIDTGVDAGHPDLVGSVLPGDDLTESGNALEDLDGHGTSMAGLIAAHGRALGIAPAAKILPVRTSRYRVDLVSSEGSIDWAVQHGARVLCLAYKHEDYGAMRREIQRAVAADVVVVAAVGNVPDVASMVFPAAYPGVVGAAGVDQNGNHAEISVVSPFADLAAPAVQIRSTGLRTDGRNGYRFGTGTSDSTAIIAGAAALVRAKYPNLSAAEVIRRLTATADDKGAPGRDDEYGYGVINIVKALTADVPPLTPAATAPLSPQATPPAPDNSSTIKTIIIVGALLVGVVLMVGGVAVFRRQRDR